MSAQNIHFHDEIGIIPKISLNTCFLSEEFPGDYKTSSK